MRPRSKLGAIRFALEIFPGNREFRQLRAELCSENQSYCRELELNFPRDVTGKILAAFTENELNNTENALQPPLVARMLLYGHQCH